MKKIICLILIVLMLPLTLLTLTACKEEKKLSKFYSSYTSIADSNSNLALVLMDDYYGVNIKAYKIDIDYNKASQLSLLVENSSTKYHHLKYFYQQLLDDSLAPLYFYGQSISSSDRVSKSQTKNLYKKLSALEKEYDNIDYYLGILNTSLKATDDETINLSYLKKLFDQYERALVTAGDLSALVCDVYFNTVLSNSNPDYSSKTASQLSDADLTSISINIRNRLHYYKSVYANVYTTLNIQNKNLAYNLTYTDAGTPSYAPYDYISEIQSITSRSIESLRANKDSIYTCMLSLHSLQCNITEAYRHFNAAVSHVQSEDTSESSKTHYSVIISQFAFGIAMDSYEIMEQLINKLYY